MALTRVKNWSTELLTSSDLNDEFNNLITNDALLGFPRTADAAFASFKATFDADADTYIQSSTDNELIVAIGGTLFTFKLSSGGLTVEGASGEPVAVWQPSINVSDNLIINGGFGVAQRGVGPFVSTSTPPNSDGEYLLDRWILLSDGNNVVSVDREILPTAVTAFGAFAVCKMTVLTGTRKFGIFQPIESFDSKKCRGGKLSLSFDARKLTGAPATQLRAGVVSWGTGTADVITSDIVSAWNAFGTNPSIAAGTGWTFLGDAPVALTDLTDTYQRFKIENITVPSTACNNLGVFIWIETDIGVGDGIYIGNVQLELGEHSTPFRARRYVEELAECQRFFERIGGVTATTYVGSGFFTSLNATAAVHLNYTRKRDATPVATSSAEMLVEGTGGTGTTTGGLGVAIVNERETTARINLTGIGGTAGADGSGCIANIVGAAAYIDIDAEL